MSKIKSNIVHHPFGSIMSGRGFNSGTGKFGFNGMLKDDEVKGAGNSLDFGARIYDSRLGRWMSVDPLSSKYPSISPFVFCINSPIQFIDPNGEYVEKTITKYYKNEKGELQIKKWHQIFKKTVLIEKHFKLNNAKAYNLGMPDEIFKKEAGKVKSYIENKFTSEKSIYSYEKQEDGSYKETVSKTVKSTFEVVGDVEIVTDINQINSLGKGGTKKLDHLFVIASDEGMQAFRQGTKAEGLSLGSAVVVPGAWVIPHEILHNSPKYAPMARGDAEGHNDGVYMEKHGDSHGTMSFPNDPANFDNLLNLNPVNEQYDEVIKDIKKAVKKLDKKNKE